VEKVMRGSGKITSRNGLGDACGPGDRSREGAPEELYSASEGAASTRQKKNEKIMAPFPLR